jgi:alkylation response protein AidB-like acyl-CoA dehydrogenase
MDFSYSSEEELFRQELRVWLEANRPRELGEAERADDDAAWRWAVEWHRRLHAGGWIGIHWPREYGGRGATLMEQMVFNEEFARLRLPTGVNLLGVIMAGPALMTWGTETQKRRFLPRILSGEDIWCEGLSEPGAGSDLAAMQTRALRDGDRFVVSGQKVWTTLAHRADWCQLFVRTEPEASRHRGLSCLLVDMHSPGITVRPLRQITGDAEFNEIFLEDVRVPAENLLGPQGSGWQVLMTTLMNERTGLGELGVDHLLDQLVATARRTIIDGRPATENAYVRQRLAQFAIECAAKRYGGFRGLTRRLRGQPPGPESSTAKLLVSELMLKMASFSGELLGPHGILEKGSPAAVDNGRWAYQMLQARAMSIGGGTSEVHRNIIAERVLGLPRG